ncbi:MAG TPA: LruC domain-containing protein [Anaerolineaceae bacterium]|nr:LruC domain-containing protein [Anaerolineaceae bacterium]
MKALNTLYVLFLGGLILFFLAGCKEDEVPLIIADDILPIDKVDFSPSDQSSFGQVITCSQGTTCLVGEDQISKGSALLYNDDEGNLYIDFKLNNEYRVKKLYLFAGIQYKQLPYYQYGPAAFDQYPYISSFDDENLQNFTIKLDLEDLDQCYYVSAKLEIVKTGTSNVSAAHLGCTSGSDGLRAFYVNNNIENGLYIGYCTKPCNPLDFTFAFEDLNTANSNDMDYNDLVVQARISEDILNDAEIKQISMVFYAAARGANFDHDFSINIPVKGSSSIIINRYNAINELVSKESFTRNGAVSCSIFPSTIQALPSNSYISSFSSNTDTTKNIDGLPPCLIRSWKTIVTITINNPSLNISGDNLIQPYNPFITVKPSGEENYTLYIYEISKNPKDLFEVDGTFYPNGVIVPNNWAWPLEHQGIRLIYPTFPEIDWYNNIDPNTTAGYFKEEFFGPPCF